MNVTRYKCLHSDEYYLRDHRKADYNNLKGDVCSNDPHFYQTCDKEIDGKITNSKLLCEHFICRREINQNKTFIYTSRQMAELGFLCDSNCTNTDLNKIGCTEKNITLPSGRKVRSNELCDGTCSVFHCEDESVCNDFRYGIFCLDRWFNEPNYVHPLSTCDGSKFCMNGEDENNCTVTEETETSCKHIKTGKLVPVHNYTRCTMLDSSNYKVMIYRLYCEWSEIVKQQTNCSDPSRVGITCEINGFMSTVSKYLICFDDTISACDDKIESKCLITSSCRIHRHHMCDNKNDCTDGADERDPICMSTTKATCKRRLSTKKELSIPISWLKDGVRDCQNGEDETAAWPTCGVGKHSDSFQVRTSSARMSSFAEQEIQVMWNWKNFVMDLKPVGTKIEYAQCPTVLKAYQLLFKQQRKISQKVCHIAFED